MADILARTGTRRPAHLLIARRGHDSCEGFIYLSSVE
jgi:hypothetical protein